MTAATVFNLLFGPHTHSWRRMTSKEDYGNGDSPHWGRYSGRTEEECRKCKIVRTVRGWQAWRYEMDDAEKRVQYLRDTEPDRPHGEQAS